MDVKWIKISVGLFDNRKIKMIEALPEGNAVIVVWLKLLCLAGQVNDGGRVYFTEEIPYTEQMLASQFGMPIATLQLALRTFESFDMIEIIDNILQISNWEKYQNEKQLQKIREQTRERVKRFREKEKITTANTCNALETQTKRTGNATDKEEDKEKEKEKDKEEICAPSARERSVLDEFNELWKDYPAGRKQGKDKAYRAYVKARDAGATFEEVKEGLEGYKAYIDRERVETRYVKMAQTWFYGKCWADDYGAENDDKKGYGDAEEFYKAALKHGEMETKK